MVEAFLDNAKDPIGNAHNIELFSLLRIYLEEVLAKAILFGTVIKKIS